MCESVDSAAKSCSLIHALFNGTMFSNKNCQNVFERPTLVVFICQSIAQEKSQTTSSRGGRIYLEVLNDTFDKNIQNILQNHLNIALLNVF